MDPFTKVHLILWSVFLFGVVIGMVINQVLK